MQCTSLFKNLLSVKLYSDHSYQSRLIHYCCFYFACSFQQGVSIKLKGSWQVKWQKKLSCFNTQSDINKTYQLEEDVATLTSQVMRKDTVFIWLKVEWVCFHPHPLSKMTPNVQNQVRFIFSFFLLNNPKNLDLSYKTDLDFWDCLGTL